MFFPHYNIFSPAYISAYVLSILSLSFLFCHSFSHLPEPIRLLYSGIQPTSSLYFFPFSSSFCGCKAASQYSISPPLSWYSSDLGHPQTPLHLVDNLHHHCVYFLNTPSDVPIVIDTGASISLTPHLTDFTRTLQSANVMELKGLSLTTEVMGCGPIS